MTISPCRCAISRDGIHIRRLPVKVYWQNRLCTFRDRPFNLIDIDVKRSRLYIDEHGAEHLYI